MTRLPLVPSFWEDATIADLLVVANQRFDVDALRYDGRGIGYDELERRVRACADGFWELGVRPGDRIAVLVEDRPEWIYGVLGAAVLGAAPVFLTTRYSPRELSHAIEVTETTTLVVQDRTAEGDLLAEYAPLFLDRTLTESRDGIDRSVAEQLERVVTIDPTRQYDGTVGFESLTATGRESDGVPAGAIDAVEPTDTAAILFTSGTTSMPKAVVRTHRNLLPHAVDLGDWYGFAPGDELLDLFPNPSITATNQILAAISHGCTYHLVDHYDADRVLDVAKRRSLSWLAGVDTMFKDLLDHPDIDEVDTSALERVAVALVGGIDPDFARRTEAVFDAPLENAYGMSETNAFTLRSKADHPFEVRLHPGGKPAYKTGLRVDPDVENPSGVERIESSSDELIGELCIKGITVTPGYDRNETANENAFDERGWFHTGDAGSLRRIEGDYYFVFDGRLGDMFQVGGNNVSPSEVEAVIAERDGVSWAGVVGIEHDRLGAVPAAFVTLEDGADVPPETVTEYCTARLASYKVPRTVFVIEPSQIPTKEGVNGKKLRRDRLERMARERLES